MTVLENCSLSFLRSSRFCLRFAWSKSCSVRRQTSQFCRPRETVPAQSKAWRLRLGTSVRSALHGAIAARWTESLREDHVRFSIIDPTTHSKSCAKLRAPSPMPRRWGLGRSRGKTCMVRDRTELDLAHRTTRDMLDQLNQNCTFAHLAIVLFLIRSSEI